MKKHTILCLFLCLLLTSCGRLPTQPETGSGSSSSVPVESSAVQPEEPTEPNTPEGSGSSIPSESSSQLEPENPTAPDPDGSAAPGESETEPEKSEAPEETSDGTAHWLTVGSDKAQSSPYSFTIPEDGTYTFLFQGESSASLEIYVLEAPFEDGIRYLPQAYQPVSLSADGSVPLKAGWQVYCFSSADVFSASASSVLTVDYTEGPVQQGTLSQLW